MPTVGVDPVYLKLAVDNSKVTVTGVKVTPAGKTTQVMIEYAGQGSKTVEVTVNP